MPASCCFSIWEAYVGSSPTVFAVVVVAASVVILFSSTLNQHGKQLRVIGRARSARAHVCQRVPNDFGLLSKTPDVGFTLIQMWISSV